MRLARGLVTFSLLLTGVVAPASASITNIIVTNNSAANENLPTRSFQTQSALLPVTTSGLTTYFNHHMAFRNQFTASGGVAQTHRRNVIFTIDFTVEDPSNHGFTLEADSGLFGTSAVTVTSAGRGDATGASFFVEYDDSTDAPGTFSTLTSLFTTTSGVNATNFGSSSVVDDDFADVVVGNYVGTTSFSFNFTTVVTPTTNVFFQNNQTGFGEVDYLSSPLYGHVVKFTATSLVPEPSGMALLTAALSCGITLRRRSGS
jgi:hypothetical protein